MEVLTNGHIRKHASAVRRYAASFVGQDNADDVTQDVFVKAYIHIGDIPEDAFVSWLMTTTKRSALTFLRTRNRRQKREIEYANRRASGGIGIESRDRVRHSRPGLFVATEEYYNPDPTEMLLIKDLFMQDMPLLWKQAVWLHSYEGLSMVEVGEQLGLSYNSAWKKYRKGLREFRKRIETCA
jgi:RNA polymerase sigma factor (sigma-70 family)